MVHSWGLLELEGGFSLSLLSQLENRRGKADGFLGLRQEALVGKSSSVTRSIVLKEGVSDL